MAATRSLNSSRKKKKQLPFYELPSTKTSASIIAEARQTVRTIPTDRPYTPADNRILFGSDNIQSRPPSAYSIGARHFTDERLSRPGTAQRLPPIEKTLAEDPTRKLLSSKVVKPTPATPVQSFQDLSVFLDPPPPESSSEASSQPRPLAHHMGRVTLGPTESRGQASNSAVSMSTIGNLESRSKGELTSTHSGELELKKSKASPAHSKRSLSADTLKRFLANGLENGGTDDPRIVSAGNKRAVGSGDSDLQVERKKRTKVAGSSSVKENRISSINPDYWENEVAPLLHSLESTSYEEIVHLCELCSSLWSCVDRHGLLKRTGGTGGHKKRSVVLRTVFKLLDHKDPGLLLKVAKIIVAMQVTGKNLLNVCKLLFSLAKDESNDQLFKVEFIAAPLVEVLILADPLSEQETMVYGLGTLKLLASCPDLREQLVNTDVIVLMMNVLTLCTNPHTLSQYTPGERTHLRNMLIQLTGALRSLSDACALLEQFVTTDLIPQLASILSSHMTSVDIVFNISRLFSKLTLNSKCLAIVLQTHSLSHLFLQILSNHSKHIDIILRACFILGNMTADNPDTRHSLFFKHNPLSHLNPIYKEYLQLEKKKITDSGEGGSRDEVSAQGDRQKSTSKPEDVLIKLVRLIANLSVHPEVGPKIAENEDTIDFLSITLAHFPPSDYEELVLNSLTTFNNLSYYAQTQSYVVKRQEEIAGLLVNVMVMESNSILLESSRVCGNLSRYPDVREILVRNKVDEVMVTLLDSGHREMVYSACGVLVNLLADSVHHRNIAKNGGIRKLVEVLHDFGSGDWQLASLVCKTLWNFSDKLTSSVACFGEEETIQLISLLVSYSDEDTVLHPPSSSSSLSPSPSDAQYQLMATSWRNEFLPVARELLARIKAHHSDMIPLEPQIDTSTE